MLFDNPEIKSSFWILKVSVSPELFINNQVWYVDPLNSGNSDIFLYEIFFILY